MIPRPSHVGQIWENDSTRPEDTRLRVTCIRPSGPISKTCERVLSSASASRIVSSTCFLFFSRSMSMKSITMIPPMSRRRSWRAASRAASRFVLTTVSSRFVLPTLLPVLTSMIVIASVRSMIRYPPEGSHTLRSSALWICSTIRCSSKTGRVPVWNETLSARSGATYLREVAPDLADKVSFHTGTLPVFEEHRIVEQIHKALDRKVWLRSGGYLIIERTEAMTIIDVNTGKSVGKTNLEETVVNTNLEAARETARQLRLRDIGGIIVVDFIDMLLEQNKKKVEDAMKEALALDKSRSQVFEIGPLGLMQITRKRVSGGLVESFSETCPTCDGRGIILNYEA